MSMRMSMRMPVDVAVQGLAVSISSDAGGGGEGGHHVTGTVRALLAQGEGRLAIVTLAGFGGPSVPDLDAPTAQRLMLADGTLNPAFAPGTFRDQAT